MKLKITVHGVAYEVEVEVLDDGSNHSLPHVNPLPEVHPGTVKPAAPAAAPATMPMSTPPAVTQKTNGSSVTSPISGVVIEVKCKKGDSVKQGQILMTLEAMKMETSIASPAAGNIKGITVTAGENIREGQLLIEFE